MSYEKYVDEIIAVMIVAGYLIAWFGNNPMPAEILMIILVFYFRPKK